MRIPGGLPQALWITTLLLPASTAMAVVGDPVIQDTVEDSFEFGASLAKTGTLGHLTSRDFQFNFVIHYFMTEHQGIAVGFEFQNQGNTTLAALLPGTVMDPSLFGTNFFLAYSLRGLGNIGPAWSSQADFGPGLYGFYYFQGSDTTTRKTDFAFSLALRYALDYRFARISDFGPFSFDNSVGIVLEGVCLPSASIAGAVSVSGCNVASFVRYKFGL